MSAPAHEPRWTTSDLCDVREGAAQVAAPVFRSFGGRARFCGEIATVRCREDNSRVKEALATEGRGRILIVDGGGSLRCALLGDLIASSAVVQGWTGVVVFGAVRDTEQLASMPLGVLALAAVPRKSVRRGEGERDVVVTFAGVEFRPREHAYADADGLVVVREPWPS
ncbi:MAG TPA: ribonuclease E activity regulator RraA [Polyangiaceae bacterium]|nr:ribonuclease E activity regulator RraA [Polyangiaceae bacterium]